MERAEAAFDLLAAGIVGGELGEVGAELVDVLGRLAAPEDEAGEAGEGADEQDREQDRGALLAGGGGVDLAIDVGAELLRAVVRAAAAHGVDGGGDHHRHGPLADALAGGRRFQRRRGVRARRLRAG